LVIVSRVEKVFDEMMNNVSSASRSRVASAKSVPSMLETKRKVRSRWLWYRNASYSITGP